MKQIATYVPTTQRQNRVPYIALWQPISHNSD